MKRPRSVRVRLTLWYASTLAVVLLLYAGGVFLFLRHSLSEGLDRDLHSDFETAEGLLERSPTGTIIWRGADHHDVGEAHERAWVQVWSPDGKPLYRSEASEGVTLPVPVERLSQVGYVSESIETSGGVHLRMLSGQSAVGSLPVVIRVARSEEDSRHELSELLLIMGLGFPFAIAAAALGGITLARRALAPIERMAEHTRAITAERLGDRLPVEDAGDELGRLATIFNETLARLESSFEQLRRFTADASHELRTPLTAIRSVGEVGLRERRDEHAYREIIGSMLEEVDRLTHLVDSLLTLSRADAGQAKLRGEPVDLSKLAREVISHLGVLAEEKDQTLVADAAGAVQAVVDRFVLREALINLVDNAIKYSPPGERIVVCVREGPSGPVVEVVDRGPGIPSEHLGRIFDRFYRVDRSRSRDMGGTGLGLALARWAVEANGGRIEVDSAEGRGSTFRIALPPRAPDVERAAPRDVGLQRMRVGPQAHAGR